MKILVPTDFSMYADYAVNAAVLIAKRTNGSISLYHSADIPEDWEQLSSEIKYHDEYNKSRAIWVRDKLDEHQKLIEAKGIKCNTHFTGGKLLKNIEEVVEKEDFDLIVMGSHGASGKQEWFIGSNTQKVIRKLRKHVLVVKNELEEVDFKKALFVSGLHTEDKLALKHFLNFLKLFGCEELHIMTVDTMNYFSEPSNVIRAALKDFKESVSSFNVHTHFYKDYTIDAGIRHFSDEINIGIIGISNHKRHPIRRFFQGSNVEMIANHSKIPVLAIDYEKKV